jgi:hypothetical protein
MGAMLGAKLKEAHRTRLRLCMTRKPPVVLPVICP